MTSTARRRWSRELDNVVDGIAFSPRGPILVHCYDPPAGGMWVDDVIPGKLGAIDSGSGESLWLSPCEVGYGRGFGAGFGRTGDVIVVGPSLQGHRVVRMALDSGELLGLESIEAFDEAHVDGDLAVCVSARRVFAVDTESLQEAWEYSSEGERYHYIGRAGDRVLVVFSSRKTGKQGLLALDVHQGERIGELLPPCLPRVHGLAVDREEAVVLTADLAAALPPEVASQVLIELAGREEEDGEPLSDTLSLLGLAATHEGGDAPLWYQILSTESVAEVPEISITADSGKLYVVRGALLEVHDTLTGRRLGDWTVPGLDEQVAFHVSEGAGLLAEEHRVSVFELPA